jgi:hypothetical protein
VDHAQGAPPTLRAWSLCAEATSPSRTPDFARRRVQAAGVILNQIDIGHWVR